MHHLPAISHFRVQTSLSSFNLSRLLLLPFFTFWILIFTCFFSLLLFLVGSTFSPQRSRCLFSKALDPSVLNIIHPFIFILILIFIFIFIFIFCYSTYFLFARYSSLVITFDSPSCCTSSPSICLAAAHHHPTGGGA